MENDDFKIRFKRLVAVHYCLSYIVKNLEPRLVVQIENFIDTFKEKFQNLNRNYLSTASQDTEQGINDKWKTEALQFFQSYAYKSAIKDETIIDFLKNYSQNKANYDGLHLIKVFLNDQFDGNVDVVEKIAFDGNNLYKLNKRKRTVKELDVQTILSFATKCTYARKVLSADSALKLKQVRNLVAHYLVRKTMDENLFKYCMQQIKIVVDRKEIADVPFLEDLNKAATASTGDSLNVAINSIYLRMITSVGSKEEGELLTKMKEAYGNKELRRQNLKNCSFDARLDMLKVSCQLLDDYKIEEEDFSVLNRLVSDILAMQSNLVGNLEDCIKRVIRFYKRKYQDDQSDLGEKNDMRPNYFHKNMQTVILLIVRLSEGQLQRGKKFRWQDIMNFCNKKLKKRSLTPSGKKKKYTPEAVAKAKEEFEDFMEFVEDMVAQICKFKFQEDQTVIIAEIFRAVVSQYSDLLKDVDLSTISQKKDYRTYMLVYLLVTSLKNQVKEKLENSANKDFGSYISAFKQVLEYWHKKEMLRHTLADTESNFWPDINLKDHFSNARYYRVDENEKTTFCCLLDDVIAEFYINPDADTETIKQYVKDFILSKFHIEMNKNVETYTERVLRSFKNHIKINVQNLLIPEVFQSFELLRSVLPKYYKLFYTDKNNFFFVKDRKSDELFFCSIVLWSYEISIFPKNSTVHQDSYDLFQRNKNLLPVESQVKFFEELQTMMRISECFPDQFYDDKNINYFCYEDQPINFHFFSTISKNYNLDLSLEFRYRDTSLFDFYVGVGKNSLINRYNSEAESYQRVFNEIEKCGFLLTSEVVSFDVEQMEKLKMFLKDDMFKLGGTLKNISDQVQSCVNKFEKKDEKFYYTTPDKAYLDKISSSFNEDFLKKFCKPAGFESNELVHLVKSFVSFFHTSHQFFRHSKTLTPDAYRDHFNKLCRIVSICSMLKIAYGQSKSINVKKVVDKIVELFPLPPKTGKRSKVTLQSCYKDYCISCYTCYTFWNKKDFILFNTLHRSTLQSSMHHYHELVDVILFGLNSISQQSANIFCTIRKEYENYSSDDHQVVDDLKTHYIKHCQFKQLIANFETFAEDTFGNWKDILAKGCNEVVADSKRHCLLDKLLGQDGNFEQKERKFVANLINERVQNFLFSGFHDMRKALEEHEYAKESDLYINQYYLRQKTNFYYQHLVETAHLPLWPSIPVKNHVEFINNLQIYQQLIENLDIFNDTFNQCDKVEKERTPIKLDLGKVSRSIQDNRDRLIELNFVLNKSLSIDKTDMLSLNGAFIALWAISSPIFSLSEKVNFFNTNFQGYLNSEKLEKCFEKLAPFNAANLKDFKKLAAEKKDFKLKKSEVEKVYKEVSRQNIRKTDKSEENRLVKDSKDKVNPTKHVVEKLKKSSKLNVESERQLIKRKTADENIPSKKIAKKSEDKQRKDTKVELMNVVSSEKKKNRQNENMILESFEEKKKRLDESIKIEPMKVESTEKKKKRQDESIKIEPMKVESSEEIKKRQEENIEKEADNFLIKELKDCLNKSVSVTSKDCDECWKKVKFESRKKTVMTAANRMSTVLDNINKLKSFYDFLSNHKNSFESKRSNFQGYLYTKILNELCDFYMENIRDNNDVDNFLTKYDVLQNKMINVFNSFKYMFVRKFSN